MDLLLSRKVKEMFTGSKGSHDWEHTERVYKLAVHIGEKEGADMEIVKAAAVLHDIARQAEDESGGRLCHAREGAVAAEKILRETGYGADDIARIKHCIEAHRFRNSKEPETTEARVLFDADKLDSIGAVGIGRAFLFAGEIGAKLHNSGADIEKTKPYTEEDTAYREFIVKLRKVKDRMLTKEGKRLAEERHKFMEEFFARLDKEVNGVE
ncbi:MAG TPA: HD domain-containing protein [Firmicutes bacterium]|nr:HD domain-containing protein [Bacillota bacterium]